jgi:hypothetical protein
MEQTTLNYDLLWKGFAFNKRLLESLVENLASTFNV